MDIEQVKKIVSVYKESINRRGYIKAIRYSGDELADHHGRFPHLLWMCEEILNGNVFGEKAYRWLGFMQGVLWSDDQYTINQMKDHNR